MCYLRLSCFFAFGFLVAPAHAETVGLGDYLDTMNKTEVSFQGHIKYDKSGLNDVDFTYYDAAGKPFPVTMDTGRKAREEVQEICQNSSFMISLKDLCTISGLGTVEIRGSSIFLSIDEVIELKAP